MLRKGKLFVFIFSGVILLYGVSAAFYGDVTYPALGVFMKALSYVNSDYVEPPDMSKVRVGAMRGMIEALDPYSAYLTKEQAIDVDHNKSDTGNIGVVLSKRANIICIVSAAHGGSAESAGLRPGDYVVAIDGVNVEDESLLKAESLLRGAGGTRVKTTVFRGTQTKPLDIEVTRTNEPPPAVASRMLDGKIGLLSIYSLGASAPGQAQIKLKTLISAGAQKIILDLRDCADGEPANGAELANLFLKGGVIYTSKGQSGDTLLDVKATPDKFITDLPLVVLINGSTAGPAEIAVGSLKGNGRASLIGERTFGIGSSQKRFQLKSGGVLVLSISKYYTPDGKLIQDDVNLTDTGIKPDVEAPDKDRLEDFLVDAYFDGQDDAAKYKQLREKLDQEQLNKAVEIVGKAGTVVKKAA